MPLESGYVADSPNGLFKRFSSEGSTNLVQIYTERSLGGGLQDRFTDCTLMYLGGNHHNHNGS